MPARRASLPGMSSEHFILEAVGSFFVERFGSLIWSIVTPIGSLHWDRETLTAGEPGRRADVPSDDAFEAAWRGYYESVFNPARVNLAAMRQHMPKKVPGATCRKRQPFPLCYAMRPDALMRWCVRSQAVTSTRKVRHLVVVLGDQLDGQSAAFDGFDKARDVVLQMEVMEEASYVPQHRLRLAVFFAAMRHFRDEQRAHGREVVYSALDDKANRGSLAAELHRHARQLKPERIIVLEPGDWRVRAQLADLALPIEFRADRHFLFLTRRVQRFRQSSPARGDGNLLSLYAPAARHPDRGRWGTDRRQVEISQ